MHSCDGIVGVGPNLSSVPTTGVVGVILKK
jgi:hypothetical protein